MAFITIQRHANISLDHKSDSKHAIKYSMVETSPQTHTIDSHKSVNECYFAVRGAAIILPHEECIHLYKSLAKNSSTEIQKHLQSMFLQLRPDDTLKMAVKLESIGPNWTRYLMIVSSGEESCLLGIDYKTEATIGLVLPVWANTRITLDGDGGFSIASNDSHHIFKPVSVQAMWSALQTLHKVSAKSRLNNYFSGGSSHSWVAYYTNKITYNRSTYNEWHTTDDLLNKRPPSPDLRTKPPEQVATEQSIRAKLKEVMISENLDEVTSKYIRTKIEKELKKDLNCFKSFIDEEILKILGQMDESSKIFDYLYLGSEWNASNYEELKGKGVGKILNVTREIDNFFPGMFDYYNIRVYDEDSTEMLKYWDKTFKYIRKAKDEGSKVLVHCKKGISRSASVVLAFVMKETGWKLDEAFEFVKNKRNCIRPNSGFLKQLEIYEGILDASKQRHNSLWRSKSETNLVSKDNLNKRKSNEELANTKNRINIQLNRKNECNKENSDITNVLQVPNCPERPKSWSAEDNVFGELITTNKNSNNKSKRSHGRHRFGTDPSCYNIMEAKKMDFNRNEMSELQTSQRFSIVKDRITDFESFPNSQSVNIIDTIKGNNSSGLVYNLTNQFESSHYKHTKQKEVMTDLSNIESNLKTSLHLKPPIPRYQQNIDRFNHRLESQESCDKLIRNVKTCEQTFDLSKYYMKEYSTELLSSGTSLTQNLSSNLKNIKDNAIKRTNSYDSILNELSLSLFDSHCHKRPQNESKGHKRSASLFTRNDNWTTIVENDNLCFDKSIESKSKSSYEKIRPISHSKSMPSVIEAVNQVLCSTSVVMNSLIESIPNSSKNQTNIESFAMDYEPIESRVQPKYSQSFNESLLHNRYSSKY
ncbi:protein phosphatase Slingshot homolog 2-like isoform X2 [Oppia nitens]|uniref:protein phosphatase Slingshot homolog 2-like isoform X2 n=1 Tax=Oppia nitens TaxID=1686743 RepID=UPI0023DC50E2|nr:protein phosphatase Slingshot homolog 2-like isoform X2 [Oppia nitens]